MELKFEDFAVGFVAPNDVGAGSNRKFWWKCPKGEDHAWKTSVIKRLKGDGCPICSNRKVVKSNSLKVLNPNLAKEWHPSKNGESTPDNVSSGSNRKVWWKCPKGDDHEWEASVSAREKGSGCPVCINQKVVKSNCLATLFPKLAKEWHPTKNKDLTPLDVTPGSGLKVWWKGRCGHVWKGSVRNRAKQGKGCMRCRHLKSNRTRKKNKINKSQANMLDLIKDD